jgi:hypothetical protein
LAQGGKTAHAGAELNKKSLPCEEVKEELYRLILRAKLGYKG